MEGMTTRRALLPFLVLLIACGSGDEGVAATEPAPRPEVAPVVVAPPIEGSLEVSVNGVDTSCPFFPRTRNLARGGLLLLRAMPTEGTDEGVTLEVHGFDLRHATLPVTLGAATSESGDEATTAGADGEATAGGAESVGSEEGSAPVPEVRFGYWRGGSPYAGAGSVTFESFDDGVLVGHADDVHVHGSGLANGYDVLLSGMRFRVKLPD